MDTISNFPFSNLLPHHLVSRSQKMVVTMWEISGLPAPRQTLNIPAPTSPLPQPLSPACPTTTTQHFTPNSRPVNHALWSWRAVLAAPVTSSHSPAFSSTSGYFSSPVLGFPSLSTISIFLKALSWLSFPPSVSAGQSPLLLWPQIHKLMISKQSPS